MQGGIKRVALTLALEIAPAALFAASAGFAAFTAGAQPLEIAVGGAVAAFGLAWAGLHRIDGGESRIELPSFGIDPIDSEEISIERGAAVAPDVPGTEPAAPAELLLDDILANLPADSRVVRLFDSAPVPTAGELQARIDRHLRGQTRPAVAPDATEELHQALDALRRSLR